MSQKQITDLLLKHLYGELTAEEAATLEQWRMSNEENNALFAEFSDEEKVKQELSALLATRSRIWEQLDAHTGSVRTLRRSYQRPLLVAASISLLLMVAGYLLWNRPPSSHTPIAKHMADIPAPAANRAFITLRNGQKIYIDSLQPGADGQLKGTGAQKLAADQLVYNENTDGNHRPELNTITVPKGSKPLQVTLPDGSDLWINVATSVSFMVPFPKDTRMVHVTGEAYFDVAQNASKPFTVQVRNEVIHVLGTTFNVQSYEDESITKTTLVTGKLQINQTKTGTMNVLNSGQQAITQSNDAVIVKDDADLEEVLSWKQDMFHFRNEELKSIMNQLGRWYDITVVYPRNIPNRFFTASISRRKSLSEVLKIMEQNGIHFKLEGKTLMVMP
ncbi:FecR family protein [Chitinophaga dinghuensis]|uniref:FecR family protein n=1 Tax=Chitinophaga dinghuensis TaxID=1539050 RepID=UPI00147479D6|nr:FecR family protein [Chitinophaga dinghuensis]